jgi:hypothetical protein
MRTNEAGALKSQMYCQLQAVAKIKISFVVLLG